MSTFDLFNGPPFIAALLNLFLAGLALKRNPKQPVNQTFAAFNICMALWNVNNFILYSWRDPNQILLITQWTRDFLVFMFSTFFHFVLAFTGSRRRLNQTFLWIAYGLSLGFLVANHIPGLFITVLHHYYWGYYPMAGPVGHLFPLVFNFYIIFAIVLLYRAAEASAGYHQHQFKLMFLATLLFFASAVSNFMLVLGYASYPFGNIGNIIYSLLVGYAVVTIGLMDIHVALRRGFVYLGLGTSLSMIYVLFVALVKQMFLVHDSQSAHQAFEIAAVPLTLALAPRMKSIVEPLSVRLPFWRTYNDKEVIKRLSQQFLTTFDLSELAKGLANELESLLQASKVVVFVQSEQDSAVFHDAAMNSTENEFSKNHPLVRYLFKHKTAFVIELAQWDDEHGPNSLPVELREYVLKTSWALLIPCFFREELIGLLALGPKLTGEMYNSDDLQLLETLAGSMSMAISNANSYRIIKSQQAQMERQREVILLGTIATEMAHELSKPLTHIMNAGSRLEQSVKGVLKENLRVIEKETQRASEILDGFAMLAPGRTLHCISVALSDILKESVESLGLHKDSKVQIICEYNSTPEAQLNPGQMVQVFTNVIQNAWQAMPGGGEITLSLSERNSSQGARTVRVSIADTGPGIPKDIQGKVFDPFFSTKQDRAGRGMGLAISRAMVERHGGRITIQSPLTTLGGTEVIIELPCEPRRGTHEA